VEWLGDVPAHWNVQPLKRSTNGCFNGIWGGDPSGNDDLVCVRVADFDRHSLRVKMANPTLRSIPVHQRSNRMLQKGDLLLEKSGGGDLQPVGVVILYDHEVPAVNSNFIARLPAANGFVPEFLVYLHSAMYSLGVNTRSIKQTTGIQNLDSTQYLSENVCFPPPDEQAAIVRFLDAADTRIRRYIRAKQKLIKLLNEQKQVIIQQAVTRGLDPDAPMKDSGVPWLGEIPAHWEVLPLKRRCTVTDCKHLTVSFVESGVPVASLRQLKGLRVDLSQAKFTTQAEYEHLIEGNRDLRRGDIIYARNVTVGEASVVATSETFCMGQDVCRLRPTSDSPWFLVLQLRTPFVLKQLENAMIGSTFRRINVSEIREILLCIPPMSEQNEITSHIWSRLAPIDDAIESAKSQIRLVREYRSRMIADVVTGKMDVRGAVAVLPEAFEEEAVDEYDEDGMVDEEMGGEEETEGE